MTEVGQLLKGSNSDDRLFDKIVSIRRISETVNNTGEEKLTETLGALKLLVGFDAATIYLVGDRKRKLKPAASLMHSVPLSIPGAGDPTAVEIWEANLETPIMSTTVSASTFNAAEGRAHILSVPMMVQERVNGVLNLAFINNNSPSLDTRRLALMVGAYLSTAVERCQYRRKLTALYETLSKLETTQRLGQSGGGRTQNLEEAQEMLVSISHEVNNSLSVIIGNVQCLLMDKKNTDDRGIDRLQRIESAAIKIGMVNKRLLQIPAMTKENEKNKNDFTVKI